MGKLLRCESLWGMLFYVLLVLALVIPPAAIFNTLADTYLLHNPTQEQMLIIIEADPQNRVWYTEARYIMGGSSLVEVDIRARTFERDRISNFLDEVGVEYTLIRTGQETNQ